ncbi:hypothetical protein FRB97_009326 [Tulasnella sp. 331]|nr:hypothetical protein FRB97_009326 [Tulasnella sp. 331]
MFSRKHSHAPVTTAGHHRDVPSSRSSQEMPQSPVSIPPTPGNENGFYFSRQDLKAVGSSGTYDRSRALDDLSLTKNLLRTFLGGKMVEAENIMQREDPHFERLYTSAGWAVVQSLKALMSFEEKEISQALVSTKHAALIAGQHRKPASSLAGRLAGLVVGNGSASGVGFIKSMTPVERHAELVYCECLLQKAILGIGDWLTFIREFINIRSATNVYRTLDQFVRQADAEAVARGEGPTDVSIDKDFRSGVSLGNGVNALVLSLLPDSVGSIVALFGFKGDRTDALNVLRSPGGWSSDTSKESEPTIGPDEEGLRRPVADLMLLVFHLYISTITYAGVSVGQARSLLDYNLKLYPGGVFFLFLKGRLFTMESRPALGLELYHKGMDVTEYRSLKNVAQWEIGLGLFMLCDWEKAIPVWREQEADANWSKATYAYALAVAHYETGGEENIKEALRLMAKVPTVTQKIGGKSLPIEKFASRKSRKFEAQGHRLLHPGLEFSYMLSGTPHTSRTTLLSKHIPALKSTLSTLTAAPSTQKGYWDDLALANFLYGTCLRYVAYPDPEAIETEEEILLVDGKEGEGGGLKEAVLGSHLKTSEDIGKEGEKHFMWVINNGPKIELDHQYVYTAHLELGKLYACLGDKVEAKRHLELVVSGKPLEINTASRKGGKYSMQNGIHVKSISALEALDSGRQL